MCIIRARKKNQIRILSKISKLCEKILKKYIKHVVDEFRIFIYRILKQKYYLTKNRSNHNQINN